MSMSKDKGIAREFTGALRKRGGVGYVHVLHLRPGVCVYDMKREYGDNAVSREKEVVLLPNVWFEFVKCTRNRHIHWNDKL
jgi:hypothetical protein